MATKDDAKDKKRAGIFFAGMFALLGAMWLLGEWIDAPPAKYPVLQQDPDGRWMYRVPSPRTQD